jgi:hypothetical protein
MGMVLQAVNGQTVSTYEESMGLIKSADRPVTLLFAPFTGPRKPAAAAQDDEPIPESAADHGPEVTVAAESSAGCGLMSLEDHLAFLAQRSPTEEPPPVAPPPHVGSGDRRGRDRRHTAVIPDLNETDAVASTDMDTEEDGSPPGVWPKEFNSKSTPTLGFRDVRSMSKSPAAGGSSVSSSLSAGSSEEESMSYLLQLFQAALQRLSADGTHTVVVFVGEYVVVPEHGELLKRFEPSKHPVHAEQGDSLLKSVARHLVQIPSPIHVDPHMSKPEVRTALAYLLPDHHQFMSPRIAVSPPPDELTMIVSGDMTPEEPSSALREYQERKMLAALKLEEADMGASAQQVADLSQQMRVAVSTQDEQAKQMVSLLQKRMVAQAEAHAVAAAAWAAERANLLATASNESPMRSSQSPPSPLLPTLSPMSPERAALAEEQAVLALRRERAEVGRQRAGHEQAAAELRREQAETQTLRARITELQSDLVLQAELEEMSTSVTQPRVAPSIGESLLGRQLAEMKAKLAARKEENAALAAERGQLQRNLSRQQDDKEVALQRMRELQASYHDMIGLVNDAATGGGSPPSSPMTQPKGAESLEPATVYDRARNSAANVKRQVDSLERELRDLVLTPASLLAAGQPRNDTIIANYTSSGLAERLHELGSPTAGSGLSNGSTMSWSGNISPRSNHPNEGMGGLLMRCGLQQYAGTLAARGLSSLEDMAQLDMAELGRLGLDTTEKIRLKRALRTSSPAALHISSRGLADSSTFAMVGDASPPSANAPTPSTLSISRRPVALALPASPLSTVSAYV